MTARGELGFLTRGGPRSPAPPGGSGTPVGDLLDGVVEACKRGNMFLTSGAASLSGVQPKKVGRIGPLLRSGLVI